MKFLFPGFLFALASVAIPVIIHLFNFRKFKKIYFSNVSYLKEIQQQTQSSRKIKNLLLLIARMLCLIFLVLAFAQPYIPESGNTEPRFQNQAVSVFIDNSYSMESLNTEGTLLDEAKRRAREIAAAYSLNDKFQLLTNDFEGRHQRFLSYDDFLLAVSEVKISSRNRNLQQVLDRQSDLFSSQANAKNTSYILSDFQKSFTGTSGLKSDSLLNIRFVRLNATELANISVDSVWFSSPIHRPNQSERVIIQLRNNSGKKADDVPVKVLIDGVPKALASFSLEARSTARDTVIFSGLSAGWKRGEVVVTDYPVVFDDNFYFAFDVKKDMQVLAISEPPESKYVNAVYNSDPFFTLKNSSVGNIDYSNLSNNPLIVLAATRGISSGLASQLKAYVQGGGSLIVFPSLEEELTGYRVLSQTLGISTPLEIINSETKSDKINLQHPLFRGVFSQMPGKLNLPTAKKYIKYSRSYRRGIQSIISFPGGNDLLSQFSMGKGKVYLSAVALSDESSNLIQHSVFLPIMFQAAFQSLRDNRLFYTIGEDQFLETSKITLSANQTLRLKKDKFEAIPDVVSTESGSRLFISDQIREKGVFQLLKADSLISLLAFNDDRKESELTYLSDAELGDLVEGSQLDIFNPDKGSVQNAVNAVNNGVQLWKLCLILALVFLAAEILIVRFYINNESKLTY